MDDPTEAERFLLTTYDCVTEHPRELVCPSEVGIRLGIEYDRVHQILDELQAAGLLRRMGSRRILADARILVTDRGFEVIREIACRRTDSRTRILVVVDEPSVRRWARQSLEHLGYSVVEAASSEAALDMVATLPGAVHVLLVDVSLPDLSGPALAERLKQRHPQLQTVFMSGRCHVELTENGTLPEGASLLEKPFSLAALQRAIQAAHGES